ncbi:MAG: hypothetical protein AAFP69_07945 [Planctomycetota bacterium]
MSFRSLGLDWRYTNAGAFTNARPSMDVPPPLDRRSFLVTWFQSF